MSDDGCVPSETAEPRVADVVGHKQGGLPPFVHSHPEETVRAAIESLREYEVSQLPVLNAEPPVMAAEELRSIVEGDLPDALVPGRRAPDHPRRGPSLPRLPTRASG